MTEGGLVLGRPDEGRGYGRKNPSSASGVEDVFDVGDLGGRTRELQEAQSGMIQAAGFVGLLPTSRRAACIPRAMVTLIPASSMATEQE